MKKNTTILKHLFILGLSFCFLHVNSNSGPNNEALLKTGKTIKENFKLVHLSPIEQKIEILFTTGDNGKINFVLAKTDNVELKKEIEKQFYQMSFPLLSKEMVNSVVLSFKKI